MIDPNEFPYGALKEELDRTGVISRDFKNLILAYASKIAEVAYSKGFEDGKKKEA